MAELHTGNHHNHIGVDTNPPPVVQHTHSGITHAHDNYIQHTHPSITHDGASHEGDHHDHTDVATQEIQILENNNDNDSLVNFGAYGIQGGNEIKINWETSSEVNIIGFDVYRKVNGENDDEYTKLTDEAIPAGNSPYEFLDADKVPNTHYIYRVVAVQIGNEDDTTIGLTINPNKPLPVTLSLFNVRLQDGSALIKWVTESEIDNAGFNIYRTTTRNGKYVKVNDKLIIGKGTTSKRSKYEFTDHSIRKGVVYYYLIEDVSFAGYKTQLLVTRLKGYINSRSKFIIRWAGVK